MAEAAAQHWRRVLVRTTNWLGDAVMCLPALHALRAALPHPRFTLLGPAWIRDLYEAEPFADDFLSYPKGWNAQSRAAKRQLLTEVRQRHFDAAILLQNAFEAAAFAKLAGIPVRIGYARDARGWLLNPAIAPPHQHEHERFYYLELLKRARLIHEYPAAEEIQLRHAAGAREAGRARLRAEGLPAVVIGLSPGAAFGSAKRWYADRFAAAAIRIAQELGAGVAVFGSPDEVPITAAVSAQVAQAGLPVRDFAGRTTLREFIGLIAACRLMLTNDSGAMHVAYACGTPSVTVFGPTDPIGTGPVGPWAKIVRQPVDCSPCKLRECPIDHRCMQRVEAPEVAQVALELIRLAPNPHSETTWKS